MGKRPEEKKLNGEITANNVQLIQLDGKNVGIVKLERALQIANECGRDLVEILPKSNPPICKIMNYSKFKYLQDKKNKKNHIKQKALKELKFGPNIHNHDLNTKLNQARKFLSKGHKVKITMAFKGRQITHKDLGEEVLKKVLSNLIDIAEIEGTRRQIGRFIFFILKPKK